MGYGAGARRLPPGPGRVRCTRSTMLHRERTHLTRGSGGASLRSPGRRGATAACGAPQGTACRPSPCPLWQGRQGKLWTPRRPCGAGRRRRRRLRSRWRRQSRWPPRLRPRPSGQPLFQRPRGSSSLPSSRRTLRTASVGTRTRREGGRGRGRGRKRRRGE